MMLPTPFGTTLPSPVPIDMTVPLQMLCSDLVLDLPRSKVKACVGGYRRKMACEDDDDCPCESDFGNPYQPFRDMKINTEKQCQGNSTKGPKRKVAKCKTRTASETCAQKMQTPCSEFDYDNLAGMTS